MPRRHGVVPTAALQVPWYPESRAASLRKDSCTSLTCWDMQGGDSPSGAGAAGHLWGRRQGGTCASLAASSRSDFTQRS